MEEYRLFVEHVNKLVDRRQTVSSIYLTVNTAIVGAIGLVILGRPIPELERVIPILLLLFAGVVACDLWRRLVIQYSALLGWWFEQLRALEDTLPSSNKLLSREYNDLYVQHKGRLRIGLTRYETRLTWLFTAFYVTFAIVAVVMSFFT